MKKCPVCDHLNKDIASKCEHCGSDLFAVSENTVKFPKKTQSKFAPTLSNMMFWAVLVVLGLRVLVHMSRQPASESMKGTAEMGSAMGQAIDSGSASSSEGIVNLFMFAVLVGLVFFGVRWMRQRKKKHSI